MSKNKSKKSLREIQLQIDLFVNDNLERIEEGKFTGLSRDGSMRITSRSTTNGINSYVKSIKSL